MLESYKNLINEFKKLIPAERIFSEELLTLAYGTDASFYRLIPKVVVKVKSEDEVVFVIKKCNELNIPITFRASGTSLSGQAISDSVLLVADRSWDQIKISEDKSKITLQPTVLGGRANLELSKFHKKIGPDPASINAATVCGIASNNASGMTSGVTHNCYNTVADMRIVFANGEVLNTADGDDKIRFIEKNREFIVDLLNIAWDINKSAELEDRIRNKYYIKNTTGYSVNSFVDYRDPIEIIKHLMIGSEGTLGFISQITLNTVPSLPYKATALILFPDIKTACSAIPTLKELPVDAAEIMDRASLKSVENKEGLPEYLKTLNKNVAALLIETSAETKYKLEINIAQIIKDLENIETVRPIEFTTDPKEYLKLWNVRKGLFPSVSKSRPSGTTIVIEDVNFNTSKLADAVLDLQKLFNIHGYDDTIIWGHALSGNIHFVFAQDFNKDYEIKRYERLMNDVVQLVIEKYDGSLKAEHGTGRNMAPFVKYEWGSEIYDLMVRTKKAFDPKNILNPGVLINSDSQIHLKNLKPTPIVNPIIDKCIDCGFCENVCPSKNLTLTPRQRITIWREISKQKIAKNISNTFKVLNKKFIYYGEQTCATDGLCELACPVGIDTGKLIKQIRSKEISSQIIAKAIAKNFRTFTFLIRKGLQFVALSKLILGEKLLVKINKGLRFLTRNKIPLWNKFLPSGIKNKFVKSKERNLDHSVVYFPSCISRNMGNAKDNVYQESQTVVMESLLKKANYNVIYPKNMNSLCCGMPFSSKGYFDLANMKAVELQNELLKISEKGKYPILFDTSPCTKTFSSFLKMNQNKSLKIYDSVEFIYSELLNNLKIIQKDKSISIHPTCSTTKMEQTDMLISIAKKCVKNVFVPQNITCCGFAGDRGFTFPELNESALNKLDVFVKEHNCESGYSSSKTCEIGLSNHSGISYQSIIYLVDECSEPDN